MSRTKQVQIPADLWSKIIYYFLSSQEDEELYNSILDGIDSKLKSQIRRELYTKYKTAPTPEEQEAARQKYLDSIGVPEDFRY